MLRSLLWTRLENGGADAFEAEALGLDLLNLSLQSVRPGKLLVRRSAQARRRRAVERVKEAVASAPSDKWNVAKLARVANLSPFHFATCSARWSVPPSTITCCTSGWRGRSMPCSTAAMT